MLAMHSAKPKPKIAFVVSTFFQIHAFMRPHIFTLAKKYDITVCLPDDLKELREDLDLPVSYHFISIKRQISPLHDLITLLEIFWHFKKVRYCAVHTITPKAGLLGTLASYAAGVPTRIHTYQGEVWATATGQRRQILRGFDRLTAKLSTHQTIVSKSEQSFLQSERVLHPTQGVVLGNGSIGGVDLERFYPNPIERKRQREILGYSDEDVVFIFLGRITADKGIKVLENAFASVVAACPKAKLLLVGPDEGAVPNTHPSLTVKPFDPQPEAVLQAADVLVLPSFREGFGVVVLEAAACGLPAIGSNIYGLQDAIIDGQTGFLFPAHDSETLARHMIEMCNNSPMRLRLGRAARQRVEKDFAQDAVVAAFNDYYEHLRLASEESS
jgi:glycosyltransferase involved in cell wall biosynthesis